MASEFESAVGQAVMGDTYNIPMTFAEMTVVVKALRGSYEQMAEKTAAIMESTTLNEDQKQDGLGFMRQAYSVTRALDERLMQQLDVIDKTVVSKIREMPDFREQSAQLKPVVEQIIKN